MDGVDSMDEKHESLENIHNSSVIEYIYTVRMQWRWIFIDILTNRQSNMFSWYNSSSSSSSSCIGSRRHQYQSRTKHVPFNVTFDYFDDYHISTTFFTNSLFFKCSLIHDQFQWEESKAMEKSVQLARVSLYSGQNNIGRSVDIDKIWYYRDFF